MCWPPDLFCTAAHVQVYSVVSTAAQENHDRSSASSPKPTSHCHSSPLASRSTASVSLCHVPRISRMHIHTSSAADPGAPPFPLPKDQIIHHARTRSNRSKRLFTYFHSRRYTINVLATQEGFRPLLLLSTKRNISQLSTPHAHAAARGARESAPPGCYGLEIAQRVTWGLPLGPCGPAAP